MWQKNQKFAPKAVARLHQNSDITNLAVDRHFAYSGGKQDLTVCVWSVPDLKPVLKIAVDEVRPETMQSHINGLNPATESTCSCRLREVSAVQRPTSRWSGVQAATRNSSTPRGMLFVAGVVAEGQEIASEGAAVLMEWSMGTKPGCQFVQIAHDTPIVSLAYGPFDNGPLITADTQGIFRVWEYTPRLWCSQQIDKIGLGNPRHIAMAMDPQQRALYSIVGDGKLLVWRQHRTILSQGETN